MNLIVVNNFAANALYLFGSLWPSLIVPADKVNLYYPVGTKFLHLLKKNGYTHLQATKPDTVGKFRNLNFNALKEFKSIRLPGVALSDSPVGLAAYLIESFSSLTRKNADHHADGGLLDKFTMDELLDNVMIYWVTNSITTSMRLFSESFSIKTFGYQLDRYI